MDQCIQQLDTFFSPKCSLTVRLCLKISQLGALYFLFKVYRVYTQQAFHKIPNEALSICVYIFIAEVLKIGTNIYITALL